MDLEQLLALGASVTRELKAEAAGDPAASVPRGTAPAQARPVAPPAAAPVPAQPAAPESRKPAALRASEELWTLPGFGDEVRVVTSFGELPLKALRVRDPLRTSDGDFVQVQWIDRLHLDEGFLHSMPDAQPVKIAPGALGRERPRTEILVSPHQLIGTSEVQFRQEFRTARDLTGRPGIMRLPETGMTYNLFHCGRPVTVMVEGVWVHVAP